MSVGTDGGPGLAKGLADKPDKGSADGAGLSQRPGVATNDGLKLAQVTDNGTVYCPVLDKRLVDGAGLRDGTSGGIFT